MVQCGNFLIITQYFVFPQQLRYIHLHTSYSCLFQCKMNKMKALINIFFSLQLSAAGGFSKQKDKEIWLQYGRNSLIRITHFLDVEFIILNFYPLLIFLLQICQLNCTFNWRICLKTIHQKICNYCNSAPEICCKLCWPAGDPNQSNQH